MMVTRNALQRPSAEGWQPPRNREERRRTRIEQERQFRKRARELEHRKKRKEAIKETAGTVLMGLAFGAFLAWMLFFAPDPEAEYKHQQAVEWQQEHQEMIPAIGSDHLIPADQYDQYLAEREAYLQEERYWAQQEYQAALDYQKQIEEAGD